MKVNKQVNQKMKKTCPVVIGIIKFGEKILLLKRTPKRLASPNKWQPVSGSLREGETAEEAILREIKEETGLKGKIEKAGEVFEITDKWGRWIEISYLISVSSDKVKIDPEEHSEYKWVNPREFIKFDCVKGVKEDLEAVGLL